MERFNKSVGRLKSLVINAGRALLSLAKATVSSSTLLFWLTVASLASVCDILGFMQAHGMSSLFIVGLIFFALAKAFGIALLWTAARRNLFTRIPGIIFLILFFFLSTVNFISYIGSDVGISRRMFTALLETNPQAVTEFSPSFVSNILHSVISLKGAAVITSLILLFIALRRVNRRVILLLMASTVVFGALFLCAWCKTYQWGRSNYFVTLRTASSLRSIIEERKAYQQLDYNSMELPEADTAVSIAPNPDIVVVIGESASRNHLAIYGYPLPTTPQFSAMADSLWIFNGAYGSSTTTSLNMQRILTFKNDIPDNTEWFDHPALIPLFNRLGYTTAWISNQERTGVWGNVSGTLSRAADICIYLNEYGEDHILQQYDESLLPHLDNTLSHNDTLPVIAFLHLYGSHQSYEMRYPHTHARISPSDIISVMPRRWLSQSKARTIAHYDNSIAYTDSILATITDLISQRQRPTVMVYFSDHGENVYDDSDYNGRDSRHLAVPFVIYANSAFRQSRPDLTALLNLTPRSATQSIASDSGSNDSSATDSGYTTATTTATHSPTAVDSPLNATFSTSELCHLLLNLAGATYSRYNPEADILSPAFTPRTIYADDQPITPTP